MTQEELSEGICEPVTISRYENGLLNPSDEKFVRLMQKMGENGNTCLFPLHCEMADLQKEMEKDVYKRQAQAWVQYLKKRGYRLYILSNYSEYMLERTKAKMNFLKYMDGAVFSCDVKEVKPEPAIYKILLEDYGLKPEECVFIDDREENCRGARKLGMHAVRFHDFKQAAADLEALGVK